MFSPLHVLLLGLSLGEPAPNPPAPFTPAHFREQVAFLASDDLEGRAVGSAGAAKATEYIIRRLKSAGVTGMGPAQEWYQPFTLGTWVSIQPGTKLSREGGPSLTLGSDFIAAPASPAGQKSGELVFVGFGVSEPEKGYDDFAGIDIRGKIALLFGDPTIGRARAPVVRELNFVWQSCQQRGAAGLIVMQAKPNLAAGRYFSGNIQTRSIPCMLVTRSAAARLLPRGTGKDDPVSALKLALVADGDVRPHSVSLNAKINLDVQNVISPVPARNVLGVVAGKGELAKEAVLVSAHHDHLGTDPALIKAGKDGIYNGADDNASGCSALMLLAEALSADREKLPPSCRTVIFASFDAEEHGLVGSRYYVTHPLWPLNRTAANINFDMVGRLNRGKLLAMDSETSAFLAERLHALAGPCGIRVETRLNGLRRSDNASFLDREIPALHFATGVHADYHQVGDEIGKIDSDGGARVSWLAYRLLRETMATPSRLRYQRPAAAFDLGSILSLLFRLGIYPEQDAQAGRYPHIRFIMPGSPGSRHGLKSGDDITRVNDVTFERLEDAAIAFGRLRLDHDVKLTVQRQGKSVEVVIPAAALKDLAGPTIKVLDKNRFEVFFRYKPSSKVKSVTLAGTFNNWDIHARPLDGPDKDGAYTARLELNPGVYEYKFVADGKTWIADPTNLHKGGTNGNSVLFVGDK